MSNNKSLSRGVALVGAGMSKFGAFPGKAAVICSWKRSRTCAQSVDKGLDPQDIEALYIGNYSSDLFEGQGHTAPIMADWVGLGAPACHADGRRLCQQRRCLASGHPGDCFRTV